MWTANKTGIRIWWTSGSIWKRGRTGIDKRNAGYILINAGISLYISLFMISNSILALPASVLWGLVICQTARRTSVRVGVVLSCLSGLQVAVYIFILQSWKMDLLFLYCFIIPLTVVAVMGAGLKPAIKVRQAALISAFVCILIFTWLAYWQIGPEGLAAWEDQVNKSYLESASGGEKAIIMELYRAQGMSFNQIMEQFRIVVHWTIHLIPAFLMISTAASIYLTMFLNGWWSRRRYSQSYPVIKFTEEMLPWQMVWVVIGGLALWLLDWPSQGPGYYIGANIMFVSIWAAVYYGIAVLVHWRRNSDRKFSPLLILLILITIFIMPQVYIGLAALTGLFDAVLDYRRLKSKKEETS